MSNLLEETKREIKETGHSIDDIIFIGSQGSGHQCTWCEFEVLADEEYDEGYGIQMVASDLIIVFNDNTVMRRREYDGYEWWEYEAPFVMPKEKKKISTLFPGPWAPLSVAGNVVVSKCGEEQMSVKEDVYG